MESFNVEGTALGPFPQSPFPPSDYRGMLETLATADDLPAVLEAAAMYFNSRGGDALFAFFSWDTDEKKLELRTAPGFPEGFRGEPISSVDAMPGSRWRECNELMDRYGVRSVWTSPLMSRAGKIAGVFAVYFRQARQPTEIEALAIHDIMNVVSIGIDCISTCKLLEKNVSLLHATIESTTDGLLIVDKVGKIAGFNQKFLELWRIPEDVISSKNDDLALKFVIDQLKDPQVFLAKVRELYSQPAVESYDLLEFKDGRIFERFSKPQCMGNEIIGRVWSFRDVTERRRSELAAQAAERAKTQFLANISHEIRTPLGAILGFSELLLSPRQRLSDRINWGMRIKTNGLHLLQIVDEILDLSKAGSGKMDMDMREVSVVDLLLDVHSMLLVKAQEKGIDLTFELDSPIPEIVTTDRKRLQQVLINLIGNAVKFTETGRVRVGIRSLLNQGAPPKLVFSIKDTGEGIKADQIPNLFRPFMQADPSHTRRFGGTGLGLALARELARGLGGDVILSESSHGRGSTFEASVATGVLKDAKVIDTLKFPSMDSNSTPLELENLPSLQGVRVLLVEDSVDNQVLISRFLNLAGAEVDVASNGTEAIEKAWAGPHDLIFMDIQMPEKDGYETTQELRRAGYKGPIVSLTAHAMKEERERAISAGCNENLTKPVDRRTLIETVLRYSTPSSR